MEKSAFTLRSAPVKITGSELPQPVVSYHTIRNLWRLERDYTYSNAQFSITIASGFEFDLASVPSPFWPLIAPFKLSIAAPLVHDYLYKLGGVPPDGAVTPPRTFSRKEADKLFREIMERERVPRWRRVSAYRAVRIFGRFAWKEPAKPLNAMQRTMLR